MTIDRSVTKVIREAAAGEGLHFHFGNKSLLSTRRLNFPVAWMEPPSVVNIRGVREGCVKFRVRVYLMEAWQADHESSVESLNDRLISFFRRLESEESVFELTLLGSGILDGPLTNYGEYGAYLETEISIIF